MKKLLLILLAIIMCVSMCACGGNDIALSTDETVADGDIEFTLTSVSFSNKFRFNENGAYEALDDGKVFLVVEYTLENKGNVEKLAPKTFLKVKYNSEFEFSQEKIYVFSPDTYLDKSLTKKGAWVNIMSKDRLEVLSDEVKYIALFMVPKEVQSNTDAPLNVEIDFGDGYYYNVR